MAKRKTRTRYLTRVKKGYRSRKGLLSGNLGNIAYGAMAGFISPMIPQFLGKWTNTVAFGAGGYLLKKPALLGVAGYELGKAIGGGMFGTNTGNGNGFYE